MYLCSAGHSEVCYEVRECPVCEMESDKDREISKLGDKISELENRIGELDGEIEELKSHPENE